MGFYLSISPLKRSHRTITMKNATKPIITMVDTDILLDIAANITTCIYYHLR
jgi:hypothetical protein